VLLLGKKRKLKLFGKVEKGPLFGNRENGNPRHDAE